MDFLDPKKRRRHDIQLFFGYILVGIAILLTTTVLIYYANGFGVSRDGQLVQRGLVYVSSQPSGSNLYIDGKKKTKTNTKLNLPVGRYDMAIKRTGYHDWKRNIIVQGSSVDHYVYPLLFPKKLSTTTVTQYDALPILTTQSPDKRWLIFQTVKGDTFQVYDVQKDQKDVATFGELVVPPGLLTATIEPASWEVIEWAGNNRHMLMKRTYTNEAGAQPEYILVDRQRPDGSHNLTVEFGLLPTESLSLRDKNPELYYVHNLETKQLSTVALNEPTKVLYQTDVVAFKPHGRDILLYATGDGVSEDEARVILRDDKKSYFIRTVPRSDVYLLDIARYDGDWYAAVGTQKDGRVYYYKNPVESIDTSSNARPAPIFVFRVQNASTISFSMNAQFMAVQNGTDIYVYDNEFERAYRYKAPSEIEGPKPHATWMDGHRLMYVGSGKQVVLDYDGLNVRTLVATKPSVGGFFDRDNRYLYTFGSTEGVDGVQLNSTALRTPADL